MSINYKFNQYRVSGETAEAWSPMSYRLINKNLVSDTVNGFKVGHILYLHHLKGMTVEDIRQTSVGRGIPTNTIKSILKGFGRQSNAESYEAYEIAMYMVQNEPETLEKMYKLTVIK
ncbi:hypothetical protein ABES35_08475 [Bacillus subtilis]|uniref:hypothetical protein n=1 Tax=Bacillus subtilis TaxID=1423 RepID=UPI000FFE0567|nr:hypothetical protein [Bacillus subtilis]MEC2400916.1 hypothetical protein [Bacillus subtilis]MED4660651.1 hypothetical protein [Bacillus subtilis]MED4666239.1 hypothetical protein [Bacillus subtilis]NCT26202.1 hypothetical protein [Bacillus subtilis subsp. subtilis]QAT56931.1 hypothetical protein EQW70_05945 [Bacillus subtilis]